MRLPFGFGRRASSGDGASSGGSAASPGAGVPAGGAGEQPSAAPPRAWASLPPIQRTAGRMPLVAAPADFAESLPGSHALPPIVEPLGHEVSPLATPGLVVARARPVEVAHSATTPAPVQRTPARRSRSVAEAAASVPAAAVASEDSNEASPGTDAAATMPVLAPIRSLPTVSRLTIRMPDRPLTSAASALRPAAVQRAAASATRATAAVAPGASPAPATGGMRRVPAAVPLALSTVSRQAAAPVADPAPSASTAFETVPARHRIGEPLSTIPASARPLSGGTAAPLVSRSTTRGPMQIAASNPGRPAQRPSTSTNGAGRHPAPTAGSPESPTVRETGTRLQDLPFLAVARSVNMGTPGMPAVAALAAIAPAARAPEIRPIAAANPIRPAVKLQRSPADEDDDAAEETAFPSPWWAPTPEAIPQVHGFGGAAEVSAVPVQRSAIGVVALPDRTVRGSDLAIQAFESASPRAVQRIAGRPAPSALPLRGASRQDSGPAATTTAISQLAAGPAGPAALAAYGRVLGAPVIQASADRAASLGQPAQVQRADGTVAVAAPEVPEPVSSGGVSPSGAPSGGASSDGHSERDLDELAQALFGRIRGLVRSDLIHDREAKGLTFDNV